MMTSQLTASRFLTALLLIAALCAPAAAQTDFPTAPVRIIVPFAAGGPTDVVTRILGDLLSARWGGKPVVIENRPGAGTIVATEAIAKGTPDGTTVGMATNTFLINPAIEHSLPYDTEKDFAGVSMVATQPVALVANKSFPANTVAELVDYAKKSAEPLNYTSPGPRGVGDLAGKMLEQRAGIKMVHINYNGSAPALTDVIGGRVPIMFDIWHSAQPYVDSGDLEADRERQRRPAARRAQRRDDRRNLSGLYRDGLSGRDRTSRHSAGHPRQVFGRYSRHRVLVGVRRAHRKTRHRRLGRQPTRVAGVVPPGNRALAGVGQNCQYQSRMNQAFRWRDAP